MFFSPPPFKTTKTTTTTTTSLTTTTTTTTTATSQLTNLQIPIAAMHTSSRYCYPWTFSLSLSLRHLWGALPQILPPSFTAACLLLIPGISLSLSLSLQM